MKTKHLFTFLGLSALLAACSNEELLEQNSNPVLPGREIVKFDLAPEFAGSGVNTRQINENGKFLWTSTDFIGACLVDPSTQFTPEDGNHFGNNKYYSALKGEETAASTSFSTDATMVAGAYVFYHQFAEKMSTDRTGIKATLPQVQKYDAKGEEMMKNNFMVSPAIVVDAATTGNVKPIFRSIYGYGDLRLKFDAAVEVQKIILTAATGEEFVLNSVVTPMKLPIADLRATPSAGVGTITSVAEADKAIDVVTVNTSGSIIGAPAVVATAKAADDVTQIALDCLDENGTGVSVALGAEFRGRLLIPARAYTGLKMEVYTDKGVYTTTFASTVNVARDYTINFADVNRTKPAVKTLELKTPVAATSPIVISQYDLLAVIKGATSGTATSPTAIAINVLGTNVVIDQATVAALGDTKGLTVDNAITIDGKTAGMIVKNVACSADVTVKGKVTLGAGFTAVVANALTIGEGANVTILAKDAGNNGIAASITNEGTLTFAAPATKAKAAPVYSVLTGTISNSKGCSIAINVNTTASQLINTAGTVTIAKGCILTTNGENKNETVDKVTTKGTITNEGTFKANGSFTNSGVFTNKGIVVGTTSAFVNNGILNNTESGASIEISANGKTGDDAINAVSKINTGAGSMTTVAANYASIYYAEDALISSTSNAGGRYGHVVYTFEGATYLELCKAFPAGCSKVILTKDFTVAQDGDKPLAGIRDLDAVEVTGGAMTISADTPLKSCPVFIAGNTTLKGSKTLQLDDKSALTIDKDKTFTINGGNIDGNGTAGLTITNNGTVQNFGNVTNVVKSSSAKGIWKGTAWVEKTI